MNVELRVGALVEVNDQRPERQMGIVIGAQFNPKSAASYVALAEVLFIDGGVATYSAAWLSPLCAP